MRVIKLKLTIVLLFFIHLTLNSQSLLQDGTEWRYNLHEFWQGLTGYNDCYIEGDTIIEGKNCKIYHRTHETCDLRPQKEYLYEEENRVYYYDNTKAKFVLLYDYSVSEGDIITLEFWEGITWYEDTFFYIKVDSLSLFEYGTNQYNQFHVSFDLLDDSNIEFSEFSPKGIIIEQLGSLHNYFYFDESGFCDGKYNKGLRCFTASEIETHEFDTIPCNSIVSINKLKNDAEISIYPNPFDKTINVESNNELDGLTLIIRSINGEELYRIRKEGTSELSEKIDLSHLSKSIYLVTIFDKENNLVYRKKIIKN